LSTKPSIRASIGTENPIPEEIDHREKPQPLYVIFLVEKDVRVNEAEARMKVHVNDLRIQAGKMRR
jgi:hypothetical protein